MNTQNEKILTILPNLSKKKGFFSLRRDNYTLVVTEQRLIFARLSKALYKKQIADVKAIMEKNKKNKVGFLSSMADRMTAYSNWFQRYYDMSIEEIISETSDNIVIEKSDIITLKVLQFMEVNEDSFQGKTRVPLLIIKTKTDKYKFVFSNNYNSAGIKILEHWH